LFYEEARENIKNYFLRKREEEILDDWYEAAIQKATIEYIK
jgi:hypothetical protein